MLGPYCVDDIAESPRGIKDSRTDAREGEFYADSIQHEQSPLHSQNA